MKKLLLVFLCITLRSNAQVVFCPPGAEWRYLFTGSMWSPGSTSNAQIIHVGDSISGPDTIKILSHYQSSMSCTPSAKKTWIRQKGDTIFFMNSKTPPGTWQILYNFGAVPGHTWQTTAYNKVFTYTVNAVSSVTINGFHLKELTLTSSTWGSTKITERLGSDAFLFHFSPVNPSSCDGGIFMESLCYRDNAFGLKQFGEKSCDYYTSNGVGIREEGLQAEIRIYPNPAKDVLTVTTDLAEVVDLSFGEISGREVKRVKVEQSSEIDVSDLDQGIYFIRVYEKQRIISTSKLIKE